MNRWIALIALAWSLFGAAAHADAPTPGTEPRKWKTFRSTDMNFEVNYPTFGHKTRVVPVMSNPPGYSFEYYSSDKHVYCGLFSVMRSEGKATDPQGLGRDGQVLATRDAWQLTLWTDHEGACSPDLDEALGYLNGHQLEARFFGRPHAVADSASMGTITVPHSAN